MKSTFRVLARLALFALVASGARAAADPGARLFEVCAQCHGQDGGGNPLFLAPNIGGLDRWYVRAQLEKFRSGARGTHPDDVAGMRMRPMTFILRGPQEMDVVAEYVASLPPVEPEATLTGGDPAKGQILFAPCTACHGPDGAGIEALGGAPVRHLPDWYLLRQLQNFRAGVRGTDPRDESGARMRPMSLTLVDEQALLDVIAYIATLRDSSGAQ